MDRNITVSFGIIVIRILTFCYLEKECGNKKKEKKNSNQSESSEEKREEDNDNDERR